MVWQEHFLKRFEGKIHLEAHDLVHGQLVLDLQDFQHGHLGVDNHNHDIESEHEVTRVSPINRNDFMSKNFISKREVSGKNSNKVMTELQSSL